jgi:hypothetical protein
MVLVLTITGRVGVKRWLIACRLQGSALAVCCVFVSACKDSTPTSEVDASNKPVHGREGGLPAENDSGSTQGGAGTSSMRDAGEPDDGPVDPVDGQAPLIDGGDGSVPTDAEPAPDPDQPTPDCSAKACRHEGTCIEQGLGGLACRCETPSAVRACAKVRLRSLDFPPETDRWAPRAVSADGSTVVGQAWDQALVDESGERHDHAARWRADTGTLLLGTPPPDGATFSHAAIAVSADGAQVLWSGEDEIEAVWSEAGDERVFPFETTDMSDDGTVFVGERPSGRYEGHDEAVRWTAASGPVMLGHLEREDCPSAGADPCEGESKAHLVSADGSVVVGTSEQHTFRWTQASAMESIGTGAGEDAPVQAAAISADGTVIVGFDASGSDRMRYWRWTSDGGAEEIGSLPGPVTAQGNELAISADGAIVVGGHRGGTAFYWDAATGLRDLALVLGEAGIDTTGWLFETATGISADGKVIVGEGVLLERPAAFIAYLP